MQEARHAIVTVPPTAPLFNVERPGPKDSRYTSQRAGDHCAVPVGYQSVRRVAREL